MSIEKLKLAKNASIQEALKIIGSERVRIALVVENDKFLGVISDSNIRRALLNGKKLEDSIETIYTKNSLTIKENTSKEELLKLASQTDIYDFPVLNSENEVIAIKSIASILKEKSFENEVVLMVGGLGSRLGELTKNTPKPMLKIGKKPILENIVLNFKEQGFKKFIFCVNYKKEVICDYFQEGKSWGVEISYIKEKQKLGTAGALSLVKDMKKSFIVMNGDILTKLDFDQLIQEHKKSKAVMSVVLREFEQQIPYGVVKISNNDIKDIEEKPMQKFLVSAGIYVLEPEVLKYIKKDVYLDMPNLIKRLLDKKLKINSYILQDYWIDIGRLEEYEKAIIDANN
ncbi:TPA: nucleotidyltransferase family protein [Campylobacter lari]|uniref:nucleotidyltransferase family protein n=1 Tax=Campylobacter TaxID=194 RepID=UPI00105A8E80|nr:MULTISPECIES: nucleotidyltransferase family protein [Campylobacter]EAI4440788.1 CBS domain-containing protein [Campylobacter lari]EDP6879554.1 CBS domain-containing protein [Campylobacter lari]MCR6777477.1 nucleotidyltransferase family protein [Campylobacter lari]MCV3402670.1 nucleotidyltransferase family protein [Campylobacter sp. IFREMER_LSEM_CL2090]MCV3409663.1 nucleotidyltransferase family protein [Campylobacter sp. IFREMER_LSEM_CL1890]